MESTEEILATTADDKYADIVEDIMNDKMSGGKFDYYRTDTSSYDPIIAKLEREQKRWTDLIAANRKSMDRVILNIENSKKPSDKLKKVTSADVASWELECKKLQEEYMDFKGNLDSIMPKIEDCKYNRLIEEVQRRHLREFRNKYMQDADFEFMSRGVTWACKYCATHRLKLDFSGYPV